jgi:menaquinone-dependent protoporphyrinogen IX oxidase
MKVLINFFSRGGNNKLVSEELATRLGADIEEIISNTGYKSVFGLFKAILHSGKKTPAKLMSLKNNPAEYDVVVLSAPIWVGKLSAPARTYLQIYGIEIKKLVFLAVCGGAEDHNPDAFKEVKELAGNNLAAELELNTKLLLSEADRNSERKVMAVHLRKEDLETVYKEKMNEIIQTIKSLLK